MSARLMFAHRRFSSAFRQTVLDTERRLAAQRRLRNKRAAATPPNGATPDMISYHEPQPAPEPTEHWSDSIDRYSDTFFVGVAVGILCSIAFMMLYGDAAKHPMARELVPPKETAAIGKKREHE